jgi:phosphotriesterase-related protein
MGHIDRTLQADADLLELAATGVIIEFDLFGIEVSKYWFNEQVDMPSDAQRINAIAMLAAHGYGHHLVLSHDIYSKHRLRKYGGHSYDHILKNIVPRFRLRGIPDDIIAAMTSDTPRRLLSIHPAVSREQ